MACRASITAAAQELFGADLASCAASAARSHP